MNTQYKVNLESLWPPKMIEAPLFLFYFSPTVAILETLFSYAACILCRQPFELDTFG